MVSFSCEVCNDTIIKKKIRNHRCRNASYTCLDCNKTFYGEEYNAHNQCVSEAEKYERSVYQPKNKKNQNQNQNQNGKANGNASKKTEEQKEAPKEDKPLEKESAKKEKKEKKSKDSGLAALVSGPTDLYKIVKKLEKESKKDKKEILKGLIVEKLQDGTIVLKPSSE